MAKRTSKPKRAAKPTPKKPTAVLPDDDYPKTLEQARGELERYTDMWEKEVADLLNSVDKRRVLFYPACGFDWQPLRWFSHLCDFFIYCDWNTPRDGFKQSLRETQSPQLATAPEIFVPQIVQKYLPWSSQMANLPFVIGNPGDAVEPWIELAKLTLASSPKQEPLWMLYFSADPIEVYQRMFAARQTAPKVICLKQPPDVPNAAWQAFVAENGPLAQAVRENPQHPLYVVQSIGNEGWV
jgi:hypothetical protein